MGPGWDSTLPNAPALEVALEVALEGAPGTAPGINRAMRGEGGRNLALRHLWITSDWLRHSRGTCCLDWPSNPHHHAHRGAPERGVPAAPPLSPTQEGKASGWGVGSEEVQSGWRVPGPAVRGDSREWGLWGQPGRQGVTRPALPCSMAEVV